MSDYTEDNEDLVKMVNNWWKNARDHSESWRKDARENYDFFAGRQWSDDDAAYLQEHDRPIITFNRTAPVINAISGFEVQNRLEVKYQPRTIDDTGGNDMYTQVAHWARDESEANDEESDAFKDVLIAGMGWTETYMDYETNPDGFPNEERVSPLEMYWDSSARKQNLKDAKYMIRHIMMDKHDFIARWGRDKWEDVVSINTVDVDEHIDLHDASEAFKYENNATMGFNKTNGKVGVAQVQWWEKEPYWRFPDPMEGKIVEASDERFEEVRERIFKESDGQIDIKDKAVKQLKRVYYQAFLSSTVLLDKKKPGPVKDQFTFQCITGYRDERSNTWNGVMQAMKDPQKWANKFFSQFLDIVSANAKGGAFAEEGAFVDPRDAEESWSDPSSLIMLKEGGINKIRERVQQPFPSATDRLLQIATGATRDVTGVNLEFLGMANREQAGSLETERKKSVLLILADIFNSLQRFRKAQGKVLLKMIHTRMREGQLIRIVGKEQAEYVKFAQQPDALDYDVIVDTAPDSPNLKQEVWNIMQNLLPAAIKAGIPIPPDIVKFSPLPAAEANKWMQYIEKQSQPDPMAQQAKQLELKEKEADIKEKESQAMLNMAKAQNEGNVDPKQMELEFARIQVEQARITADAQKAELDANVKLREIQQKEFDTQVKSKQVESRITEAQIKSQTDIEVAKTNATKGK